jgi:hypothetical protein
MSVKQHLSVVDIRRKTTAHLFNCYYRRAKAKPNANLLNSQNIAHDEYGVAKSSQAIVVPDARIVESRRPRCKDNRIHSVRHNTK